MFVQLISGQVSDAHAVRAAMDRWAQELAPGAAGWLGSTVGVTDDGRFVALARFASADDARRNSERPEQDAWWSDTSKLFTSEVVFRDSEDVIVDLVGDPDTAGFVQVMQGRVTDPDRARELMTQGSDTWAGFRPEILGTIVMLHSDGEYTMAAYFTTEEAAREGERKEVPPELAEQMAEMDQLSVGTPVFWDLREPWLQSA